MMTEEMQHNLKKQVERATSYVLATLEKRNNLKPDDIILADAISWIPDETDGTTAGMIIARCSVKILMFPKGEK